MILRKDKQINQKKEETNHEVLEEIPGKSSRSSNPKNEETKDPDKNSEAEHKENEDTEIQATVSMYFTNIFYTRINNASKNGVAQQRTKKETFQ